MSVILLLSIYWSIVTWEAVQSLHATPRRKSSSQTRYLVNPSKSSTITTTGPPWIKNWQLTTTPTNLTIINWNRVPWDSLTSMPLNIWESLWSKSTLRKMRSLKLRINIYSKKRWISLSKMSTQPPNWKPRRKTQKWIWLISIKLVLKIFLKCQNNIIRTILTKKLKKIKLLILYVIIGQIFPKKRRPLLSNHCQRSRPLPKNRCWAQISSKSSMIEIWKTLRHKLKINSALLKTTKKNKKLKSVTKKEKRQSKLQWSKENRIRSSRMRFMMIYLRLNLLRKGRAPLSRIIYLGAQMMRNLKNRFKSKIRRRLLGVKKSDRLWLINIRI